MILKIGNKKVDFFNAFSLTLRFDAVASTFAFNFYFNPNNPEHKALFRPCSYQQCTLEHNGELLLTGTILSHAFPRSGTKELSSIGGYSLPGVLEDSDIPIALYPLQSDNLSIRQIAQKLFKPFGLKMVVDPLVSSLMDQAFKTSTAGENQKIKGYLAEIAAQKNIIITHTEKGEVLFTTAKTKQKPIITYTDGMPFTKIVLAVDGQPMSNEITVMKQADSDGGNSGQETVYNPFVPVTKAKVRVQSSGTDTNTGLAARNARADEIRNIKLTITTDRWDVAGKILKPNNVVAVLSPENYIYKTTNFFIESISFSGDNTQNVATLNCVLPCVYDGSTPVNIFKA
jgi:prophage tail gpP-like protein